MNVNVPQLFHMILVTTQEFILKLFRPKNPTWFLCLDQLCIMTSRDRILLISPNIKRYQIKPECELYKGFIAIEGLLDNTGATKILVYLCGVTLA